MRLEKLQKYLTEIGKTFSYAEEDGLGSIDFEHRGLQFHVWEFLDGEYGAESNIENVGRQKDYFGDYEQFVIDTMKTWQ